MQHYFFLAEIPVDWNGQEFWVHNKPSPAPGLHIYTIQGLCEVPLDCLISVPPRPNNARYVSSSILDDVSPLHPLPTLNVGYPPLPTYHTVAGLSNIVTISDFLVISTTTDNKPIKVMASTALLRTLIATTKMRVRLLPFAWCPLFHTFFLLPQYQ